MGDYVKCPRCQGDRYVMAYTRLPTEFTRGQSEEFACPLCSGTGEADADDAAAWVEDQEEED